MSAARSRRTTPGRGGDPQFAGLIEPEVSQSLAILDTLAKAGVQREQLARLFLTRRVEPDPAGRGERAPPPLPPKPKSKPVPVTDRTPAPSPVVDRTPVAPTAGSATAALIVGLAGIVMCPLLLPSIAAIIVGHKARREIAAAGGRVGGDNLAKWGIVAGWARIPWTILLFWAVLSTPA